MKTALYIFTDGGSRGNPGIAGVGVSAYLGDLHLDPVAACTSTPIFEKSAYIGEATNNVAEYRAVLEAIKWLKTYAESAKDEVRDVTFFEDSQLIVQQLMGVYKIKQQHLVQYVLSIQSVIRELSEKGWKISFHYIPREKNKRADLLVNNALDAHIHGLLQK